MLVTSVYVRMMGVATHPYARAASPPKVLVHAILLPFLLLEEFGVIRGLSFALLRAGKQAGVAKSGQVCNRCVRWDQHCPDVGNSGVPRVWRMWNNRGTSIGRNLFPKDYAVRCSALLLVHTRLPPTFTFSVSPWIVWIVDVSCDASLLNMDACSSNTCASVCVNV